MKKNYILISLLIFQLYVAFNISVIASESSFNSEKSLSHQQDHMQLSYSPCELIVRLQQGASIEQLRQLSWNLGAESVSHVFSSTTPAGQHPLLRNIYQIRFPVGSNIEKLQKSLLEHPLIEDVEVNRLNRFCSEVNPNDSHFTEQWNLTAMNVPKAWDIEKGKPSVVVAVVDSGIMVEHPDIRNQLWQNPGEIPSNRIDDDNNGYVDDIIGWDFTDAPTIQGHGDWTERDNQPIDETGHGTQVSGIIAAETNNEIGIAGIAGNCRIMTLRAGFRVGGGSFLQNDDIAAAIVYAADNGAKIINLSLGDTVNAFLIRDAVEYAYNRGCVLIAAAGNSSELGSFYPAALNNVISAAALDSDLQLGGSNFGASIDIAAPGEEILTTDLFHDGTYNTDAYGYKSGTSMAAAHISGVAALLFSANPTCSNVQVKQWLTDSARQLTIPQLVGAGLVDAYAALTTQNGLVAQISIQHSIPDVASDNNNTIMIKGSAGGTGFAQYWLEYGITETPDLWFPIGFPNTQPSYDSVLHQWDTSELNAGIYTVRLSVKSEDGRTVRSKTVVEIRHSPPKVLNHEGSVWLSGNKYNSNIIWQTDVLSIGAVEIFRKTDKQIPIRVGYSESVNFHHLVNISDLNLPSDEYLYRLIVQTNSGQTGIDPNDGDLYPIVISDHHIDTTLMLQMASANQNLQTLVSPIDINGNGRIELIALDTTSNTILIYEIGDNWEFVPVASLEHSISLLWGIADTDGDGLIEILVNESEKTFLLEQPETGQFPSEKIWEEDGIWGGTIADTDKDGIPEIISRHDATNSIRVYESNDDNSYTRIATLENPTQGRNNLQTRFAISDFDSDGLIEILSGDSDGELFIYENVGDNLYEQTWIGSLNNGLPSLFTAGDLNGDSIPEFVVGAKVWATEFDLPRQHWNFNIFSSNGNDSYQLKWNQRIRELYDGQSGITIADVNNDSKNEMCISILPNFYIVEYDGSTYQTIWHHASASTFNPLVTDIDRDGSNELFFNAEDGLSIFKNANSQYKKENTSGKVDTSYEKTTNPPQLIAAVHSPPNQVMISFNKQMDNSAANSSFYRLHPLNISNDKIQSGHKGSSSKASNLFFHTPTSAILDRSQQRVVLTFLPNILIDQTQYKVEVFGLSDLTGTEIPEDERTILVDFPKQTNSGFIVYPNPARGNKVTFDRLETGSRINIYDVSGSLIETLSTTENGHPSNRCQQVWELGKVSNGVYIYVIESNDEHQIGKVTVIR